MLVFSILSLAFMASYVQSQSDIDGCSVVDNLLLKNIINRQVDLVVSAQNAGSVSDDLQQVVEQYFAEDFTYTLQDGPVVFLYYGSRDAYLFGDASIGSQGLVVDSGFFGKLNIWLSTQYVVCEKIGNLETATFVTRGGDNVVGNANSDGTQTNLVSLARAEYSLEKEPGKQWQVKSAVIEVNSSFGSFQISN
eukprot:525636_1